MSTPAARLTDTFSCPAHGAGSIIVVVSPNVFISALPAARMGDSGICPAIPTPNMITKGSATVFINQQPAARVMDSMAHGGQIILGAINVFIGG